MSTNIPVCEYQTSTKVLGKGSFGEVIIVQKGGKNFALKTYQGDSVASNKIYKRISFAVVEVDIELAWKDVISPEQNPIAAANRSRRDGGLHFGKGGPGAGITQAVCGLFAAIFHVVVLTGKCTNRDGYFCAGGVSLLVCNGESNIVNSGILKTMND